MNESLTVVAWDDPRCVEPLKAAASEWLVRRGIDINIVRRPLTAFNDQPLGELAPICDVMIIDYPHVAQAMEEGAILPIEDLLSERDRAELHSAYIGTSQDSFVVRGISTALASDAACHVAAWRPTVLERLDRGVPKTWQDVFDLHQHAPGSVALALYSTDAISCLMSMTAGENAGPDGGPRLFPDREPAIRATECLANLAAIVDERCFDATPQQVHDWAAENDRVAYLPLTFGYSRMGTKNNGGWKFGRPPAGCGSLMGGAGMAISPLSVRRAAALDFAKWYCGAEGQVLAGRNGGQPAGVAAWCDTAADRMTGGFYSATRATQEQAFIRPRTPWWPKVQDETGRLLVKLLKEQAAASEIVDCLEATYEEIKPDCGANQPAFSLRSTRVSGKDDSMKQIDGVVRFEKVGQVGLITLDRPAKHNALTPKMYLQIAEVCDVANDDDEIHAVVFRGAGEKAFCAGSDIAAVEAYEDFWAWRNRHDYIPPLRALRKPMIAEIKGWALGGGLEIALACDLRVVTTTAQFGAPEVTLGWNGAGGAAQHLTRMCGYGQAMKYLLTGDRFSGAEAYGFGMVEWLVEPGEEHAKAMDVANRIAGHPTVATQAVKSAVRSAMETGVAMGLQIENELMSLCFAKAEHNKRTA